MNTKTLKNAKDEDARHVEVALRRAAQKARLIATQTGPPFVVIRDGLLLIETPTDTSK